MSFSAVIDSKTHHLMWSKSILSLSAISEMIKFIIRKDSLSISAINNSNTSHAEIIFKSKFFKEYQVDFQGILPEGFEQTGTDAATYSFVINSRHLATIFRNIEPSALLYVCFRINWRLDSSITQRYKLGIEIKTKKLIIKKYQTNYQPVLRGDIHIAHSYKQQLSYDNFQDPNRINHLLIDPVIPKQFLEMVPPSAEDFKIDIKNGKISFSGYTKQIIKDRDYLKQPMSVTVTISIDDLINSNLTSKDGEQPIKKCINFRLRDFKNFLNLTNFFMSSNTTTKDQFDDNNNFSANDYFEMYFKNAGDAILFELENANNHVLIQYIQITSDDKSNEMESKQVNIPMTLQSHVLQRIENRDIPNTTSNSPTKRSPLKRQQTPPTMGKLQVIDRPAVRLPSGWGSSDDQQSHSDGANDNNDYITYGKDTSPLKGSNKSPLKQNADADTDYSDSDEEEKQSKRKRVNPSEEEEEGFGPTQLGNRPKSIF
ncbi:DNA damage checkpoint protein 1 [Spathaspora sp. JA1]|nr:DNA damage checkpoint protein 1 [Spathaspora sp. JA1]